VPGLAGVEWVLISQVEHARLSGKLAEHWGAGGVAPLVDGDELVWAIAHHDDGWAAWETAPDVEPELGRPRSFTEMDLAESLEIWTASITGAAERGPLAGYAVAGHFCALLRRYDDRWKDDEDLAIDARRFLDTYDSLMQGCQKAWQARSPSTNTPQRAQLALAQLQLFDSLSLWLCCALASGADEMETPGGPAITLAPLGRAEPGEPIGVSMSPWPLTVAALEVAVAGRAVPVRRYLDRDELAGVTEKPVQLRWQLQQAKR
jgi:hypothetical protein